MNIKAFYVDALGGALELGIGTPEDVLRHVTPDVLATHLPRPLWARVLTACLGAPRVDAQLIIETIGIANLCEHIPSSLIWGCISEIGARSLGKQFDALPTPSPVPSRSTGSGGVLAPPPPPADRPSSSVITSATPVAIGPSIPAPTPTPAADQPLADLITELEQQDGSAEPRMRPRSPTAQRFRQSNTQSGRTPIGGSRRPQAAAPPSTTSLGRTPRRTGTEVSSEPEPETRVESDWRGSDIPVDDSQLVDWQADGTTAQAPVEDDFTDLGRKR